MSLMANTHLAVGCCSVVAGFLALSFRKGSGLHKYTGMIFAVSMVLLCSSGSALSVARNLQFTFLLSALSLYLVLTGWWAASCPQQKVSVWGRVSLTLIVLYCLVCFSWAALGIALEWGHPVTEPPYGAYVFLGACGLLFMAGDWRWLNADHMTIGRRHQRHLTRMCASMLIATSVFFLGNNHVLPAPWRTAPLLLSPIITVALAMLFYRVSYSRLLRPGKG